MNCLVVDRHLASGFQRFGRSQDLARYSCLMPSETINVSTNMTLELKLSKFQYSIVS